MKKTVIGVNLCLSMFGLGEFQYNNFVNDRQNINANHIYVNANIKNNLVPNSKTKLILSNNLKIDMPIESEILYGLLLKMHQQYLTTFNILDSVLNTNKEIQFEKNNIELESIGKKLLNNAIYNMDIKLNTENFSAILKQIAYSTDKDLKAKVARMLSVKDGFVAFSIESMFDLSSISKQLLSPVVLKTLDLNEQELDYVPTSVIKSSVLTKMWKKIQEDMHKQKTQEVLGKAKQLEKFGSNKFLWEKKDSIIMNISDTDGFSGILMN